MTEEEILKQIEIKKEQLREEEKNKPAVLDEGTPQCDFEKFLKFSKKL